MERREHHVPLAAGPLGRRRRLSSGQWGLLAGVVALLVALELLLVYTHVGIGRTSARYEDEGASATLLSNVQRETLQLALASGRRQTFEQVEVQRALVANQVSVARAAATSTETQRALDRIRRLLVRYSKALAEIKTRGGGPATADRQLAPLLAQLEREAKRAFDRAELAFYESAGAALGAQRRSQMFLLGIGALLLVLAAPLWFSVRRGFDSQLKRLSAFPRLSPFPVVELSAEEVRYANAAAEELAARLSHADDVGALLPPDWPALFDEHFAGAGRTAVTREIQVNGRTLSWSFFPVSAEGVMHGYGEDISERKRAEEQLNRQARLNEHQALHDSLTGLGNRRKLMEDAERKLPLTSEEAPIVLAIFDLDGFKSYNDTFGHPAGDALLARLGRRLRLGLPGEATAYRMGGDEFCVLADTEDPAEVAAWGVEALREEGDSFSITASAGFALVPADAATVVQALQVADQRLYAQKRSSRASAGAQARDALIQVLVEQDPHLGSHVSNVAQLAAATAARLGLNAEEIVRVRLAAELHDIGKAAVPDTILEKPGPLEPEEWDFVKRHTLIGERILAAAPALANIAPLVRSSHERVDGTGYPDCLRGDEIPLPARIVAIADAFDAMTQHRPYRDALPIPFALAELRRCAGTQFDETVVEAFASVVESDRRRAAA